MGRPACPEVHVRVRGLLSGVSEQPDVEIWAGEQGVTRVVLGDNVLSSPIPAETVPDTPGTDRSAGGSGSEYGICTEVNGQKKISWQPQAVPEMPEGAALALRYARQAAQEIADYLGGGRQRFSVPLAPASTSPFTASVHEAIATIPYGQRWTYAQLAAALGNAGATRAVGTACGKNPLPILVPCHRVVRADGTLGRYTGGDGIKVALLALEGGEHSG